MTTTTQHTPELANIVALHGTDDKWHLFDKKAGKAIDHPSYETQLEADFAAAEIMNDLNQLVSDEPQYVPVEKHIYRPTVLDERGPVCAITHNCNGAIIATGKSHEMARDNFAKQATEFLAANGRPEYAAAPETARERNELIVQLKTEETTAQYHYEQWVKAEKQRRELSAEWDALSSKLDAAERRTETLEASNDDNFSRAEKAETKCAELLAALKWALPHVLKREGWIKPSGGNDMAGSIPKETRDDIAAKYAVFKDGLDAMKAAIASTESS